MVAVLGPLEALPYYIHTWVTQAVFNDWFSSCFAQLLKNIARESTLHLKYY
jgi:hypothetical protein